MGSAFKRGVLLPVREVVDAHHDAGSGCEKDGIHKLAHSDVSLRSRTHCRLPHSIAVLRMARLSQVGTLHTAIYTRTPLPPPPLLHHHLLSPYPKLTAKAESVVSCTNENLGTHALSLTCPTRMHCRAGTWRPPLTGF